MVGRPPKMACRQAEVTVLMDTSRREPPSVRSCLTEDLRASLLSASDGMDEECFRIRGVWSTHYWLQLLEDSTPFDLRYLLVQTNGMGCCYLPAGSREPDSPARYIGASVFDAFDDPAVEIAALDAAYGALPPVGEPREISGENFQKARSRADLLCAEVASQLPPPGGRTRRLGLVGVVGEVLHVVRSWPNLSIRATDYGARIAGAKLEDVKIEWGDETASMVREVDVALVTGMTLANGTLGTIIDAAREADTRLVIFAETGHNFAGRYLELGVDTVISEEFPFYLSGPGVSRIRVARQA